MRLTLTIRNTDRLDNGAPAEFVLNRRGAMIGRSPTCDWSLPDSRNYISSRHCEVTYRDGLYMLSDVSTNGTFLNGGPERMAEPRRIVEGDVFLVGQYEVVAQLTGDAAVAVEREAEQRAEAEQAERWGGWGAHGGNAPVAPEASGWDPSREVATPGGFGGMADHAAPLSPDGGWGAPQQGAADGGWAAGSTPAAPPASNGWGAPPVGAAVSPSSGWAPAVGRPLAPEDPHLAQGRSAMGRSSPIAAPQSEPGGFGGGGWAAPTAPPPPPQGPSTWDAGIEPSQSASGWSSAAPDRAPPPSTNDVWGALAEGNVVDWATSGFGQPLEERRDPLGLDKPRPEPAPAAAPPPPPPQRQVAPAPSAGWAPAAPAPSPAAPPPGWGNAAPPPPSPPAPGRTMPPPVPVQKAPPGIDPALVAQQLVEGFAQSAGLKPGQLRVTSPATLDRAAQLLRRLVGGLVVMVEARARAKSQMGAEATSLSFDGNNPIKFARTPEQALSQLLNPPERGFMDADKAIDDAFFDLQSHQMATLKAMQGALRATLDRFSPTAISARAEQKGLFQRIMPGAREAALWQAYEREFGGVAKGSDEAFMDVFSKEFRRAYEEQARSRKR